MIEVPTIAEGLDDLFAARMAIAVTGMSWTELVLIARNVHIALVAVPGRGLSDSRSFIARRPSGVAAFPSPSMFAAIFISIEPIAGCSGGTSGNKRRISGWSARASKDTSPARSASRMIPSHSAMMPISGSDVFITAYSAISKLLSATSLS
jgi:hypothetical protein